MANRVVESAIEQDNADATVVLSACPTDLPTHSEDGVDLTLIRWMLSLTPAQRLQTLQNNVLAILKLRDANPNL